MGLLTRSALTFRRTRATPHPEPCDLAYVGEDAVPADCLVAAQVQHVRSPALQRLLIDGFQRLQSIYASDGFAAHPAAVLKPLRQAADLAGIALTGSTGQQLIHFFNRLNRILFVHQTLEWLIDAGFSVRLYGTGWDRHPRLHPFAAAEPIEPSRADATSRAGRRARGSRDDLDAARPKIAAADRSIPAPGGGDARIYLAMGPYGAVTPRVLDGIAAGEFYLMRFCPADVIERLYPPLLTFCRLQGITSNLELRARATPAIGKLLSFAGTALGIDVLSDWPDFVRHILTPAARARSAAALFSSYSAITFGSRAELLTMCNRYLYDPIARQSLSDTLGRDLNRHQIEVSIPNPTARPAAA